MSRSDDREAGAAEDFGGLDEFAGAEAERNSARTTRATGGQETMAMTEDDAGEAGSEDGDDDDGEDEARDGLEQLGEAHGGVVDPAAAGSRPGRRVTTPKDEGGGWWTRRRRGGRRRHRRRCRRRRRGRGCRSRGESLPRRGGLKGAPCMSQGEKGKRSGCEWRRRWLRGGGGPGRRRHLGCGGRFGHESSILGSARR